MLEYNNIMKRIIIPKDREVYKNVELNISSDRCMVMKITWRTGDIKKIKCKNHEINWRVLSYSMQITNEAETWTWTKADISRLIAAEIIF